MRTYSLIFILLCSGTMLGAQDLAFTKTDTLNGIPKDGYAIAITHRTKPKMVHIYEGKKVTFWSEGTKFKGKVTSVTADSIYIDSLAFAPKAVDKISVLFPNRATGGAIMISGGAAAGVGGIVLIAETIAWVVETAEEIWFVTYLVGFVGVLGGAIITGGGVALITTGIIILARGKTFDLHKRWVLTIVSQTASPP